MQAEMEHMNTLEEQTMEKLANEMASEIDFHVLADLYLYDGWTEVKLHRQPSETVTDIKNWCSNANIIHYGRGKRWLFKEHNDAVFFSLKWS
jgi:hypothetical protein